MEFAIGECSIEAEVFHERPFPGDLRIWRLGRLQTVYPVLAGVAKDIPDGIAGGIDLGPGEGRGGGITGETYIEADFKVIDTGGKLLPPVFIGSQPTNGDGGEETPLVLRRELR